MLPSTTAAVRPLPLPLARAAPVVRLFPTVSPAAAPARRRRRVSVGSSGDRRAPERPEATLSWRAAADESVKEKHLVEHTKDRMSDYCTTLKGEECCSCWDAVEEFSKLEMELPRPELEKMVEEAGGDMDSLISTIHRRAQAWKTAAESSSSSPGAKPYFPAPDELPKTAEELEGETEAAMPESTHTRLLRRMADHD